MSDATDQSNQGQGNERGLDSTQPADPQAARAFRDFRTRQLIENTPPARIRSMAMGLVEVNGEVVPRSEHQAPFSGRPCAYWQVEIATQGRRNSWTTVHRACSGSPFFIRDETGLALVYPKDAECRVMNPVEETCSGIAARALPPTI